MPIFMQVWEFRPQKLREEVVGEIGRSRLQESDSSSNSRSTRYEVVAVGELLTFTETISFFVKQTLSLEGCCET